MYRAILANNESLNNSFFATSNFLLSVVPYDIILYRGRTLSQRLRLFLVTTAQSHGTEKWKYCETVTDTGTNIYRYVWGWVLQHVGSTEKKKEQFITMNGNRIVTIHGYSSNTILRVLLKIQKNYQEFLFCRAPLTYLRTAAICLRIPLFFKLLYCVCNTLWVYPAKHSLVAEKERTELLHPSPPHRVRTYYCVPWLRSLLSSTTRKSKIKVTKTRGWHPRV